MEFFSTRNKVISINPNGLRSTSIELRERIWNVFYKEEYDYYDTVDYTSYTTGIEDMMLEMGIRYEFPANKSAKNANVEKLHKYVVQNGGIWYRIYDFIEKYLRLMEGDKLQQITKEFNRIFEEEVAPYRILNGLVVPIIGKSELAAIGETINSKYESVGEPDLLVLDEPINGLDPQGIAEIRDTIQRLQKEKNMTICISSHILEELSKIATDYGIIHNGSLLQEITREELIRRCSERIELTLDHPKQAIPVLDSMGFTNYQVTDKEHIHIFERLNESAALNMELAKSGIPVKGISITSEELETYFLNLTGGADHA